MTNTPDELDASDAPVWYGADEANAWAAGHNRSLEERAELVATVKIMREALMAAQSFIADGGLAETDPGLSIYRQVTAALTTGEEK